MKYRKAIINSRDIEDDDCLTECEKAELLRELRFYEKQQRAKVKFQESMKNVDNRYRGLEADLACARALKLDKYTDRLFERRNTNKFACLLHPRRPWAHLYRADSGDILYKCPHDGEYKLTLPQVRASIAYAKVKGKAVNILHEHNAEHMVWRLLLLWEAMEIQQERVPHRLLPGYVREDTANVYAGFLRLLALKWNVDEWYGNGTTFGWDFAAAWCSTTRDRVRGAMKWLLGSGYIYIVDHVKANFGKQMGVFLPVGPKAPTSR